MIIKIGDYEVKIEAKNLQNSTKFNKEDTMWILSEIATAYSEASTWSKGQGYQMLSKIKDERMQDIRTVLKEEGFLKD